MLKLCGDTQEEHFWNLILRRSDGASCYPTSTAQVQKDTPNLIDVNGLGRPKEFSGKEEDVQQWSKQTEALFAGVIKESETMLEWAAEQTTEIAAELINREFLKTATNQEGGVQKLEFVLQQMHAALVALTSYEANDIVANSRKNPLEAWRRLQKRYDPTTGGRKKPFSHDHFSWTLLSSGTPSWD